MKSGIEVKAVSDEGLAKRVAVTWGNEVVHYLRAVKKYLNISHLQQYEFSTILFRTLDNARINYFRDMNREKRTPSGGLVSLDWEEDSMNGMRSALWYGLI